MGGDCEANDGNWTQTDSVRSLEQFLFQEINKYGFLGTAVADRLYIIRPLLDYCGKVENIIQAIERVVTR